MFNVTKKFSKSALYIYSFVLYGYLRVTVASDDGRTFTATCGGAHGEQATTHTMNRYGGKGMTPEGRAKSVARLVAQKHLAEGRGVRGRAYTVDHLNVNISMKEGVDSWLNGERSEMSEYIFEVGTRNRKEHLLTLKKGGYIGKPEDKGAWILR